MKKLLMLIATAVMSFALFAEDNEIMVSVSETAPRVSGKVMKSLQAQANKVAVKKYLKTQYANIPERVLDEASVSAEKFVVGKPSVVEAPSAEDGEVSAKYSVTINQEELAQFIQLKGLSANVAADGSKLEIFVMEEPPDAGQILLGDDLGSFFFTRYGMFQRRIRDALVKEVNKFGFEVILLEDNENYEEFKATDPVLVGVSYDVNADTRGFVVTPNFLKTVQENNPDAIALYYRIDAIAYDPATGAIRTTVALSFKNLATNTTTSIGSRDFQQVTRNKNDAMIMADIGTIVERSMISLINGEGAGAKLVHTATSLRNAAARPQGPMKLVINCSKVDKKIRTKFRVALKNALVENGICDKKSVKIVKDSLSCTVTGGDYDTLDDLWGAVSEIIVEAGFEDITDDAAKKNGNTLTVTPGI